MFMPNSQKNTKASFRLRLKLDVGEDAIGPGKAELLRKIEEQGSISAAAREMDINYRRAWFLLETMNSALGQPLVITSKGGSAGGGAQLTNVGRAVLKAYEDCLEQSDKATCEALAELAKIVKPKRA